MYFDQPNPVQLTTPGQSQVYPVHNRDKATIAYTVASINTNVVMKISGSTDGTNWFNLVNDQTQTANGTYAPVESKDICLQSIRVTLVSEAGGTNTVVTVHPCFG